MFFFFDVQPWGFDELDQYWSWVSDRGTTKIKSSKSRYSVFRIQLCTCRKQGHYHFSNGSPQHTGEVRRYRIYICIVRYSKLHNWIAHDKFVSSHSYLGLFLTLLIDINHIYSIRIGQNKEQGFIKWGSTDKGWKPGVKDRNKNTVSETSHI